MAPLDNPAPLVIVEGPEDSWESRSIAAMEDFIVKLESVAGSWETISTNEIE